jgi:hypothetical protein
MEGIIVSLLALVFLIVPLLMFIAIVYWIVKAIAHAIEPAGSRGERLIHNELLTMFAPECIFRNLYIPKADGKLTEIDLVAVSTKGIFVFESKNYSGWIFGSENKSDWIQSFPNRKRVKFFNPVIQNNVHIKVLRHNLQAYPGLLYASLIVFSDHCELKSINVSTPGIYVFHRYQLSYMVNYILDALPDCISEAERDVIIAKLSEYQQTEEDVKAQHIVEVTDTRLRCPFCEAVLIQRTRGWDGAKFYGCANFPQCKYTSNDIA